MDEVRADLPEGGARADQPEGGARVVILVDVPLEGLVTDKAAVEVTEGID